MILLAAAIVFCYSLIRIIFTILNPQKQQDLELQLPQMVSAGGYANPESPIRVALARDEEAAGIRSDATKHPPPAYGLWRESVVCYALPLVARRHLLTFYRGLTLTASSGSGTLQRRSVKTLAQAILKPRTDLPRIYQKTGSAMCWKHNLDQTLQQPMLPCRPTQQKEGRAQERRYCNCLVGIWSSGSVLENFLVSKVRCGVGVGMGM
jgi:hypothetical protein